MSSDRWLKGTDAVDFHFALAKLRAIEHRKYLVRSTLDGSCEGFHSRHKPVICWAMEACKSCGAAAIEVPRDLATLKLTCSACGSEQRVRDYVSDADRLRGVAGGILQAQADLRQKRESGVTCPKCGGTTMLPVDPSMSSFACQYCQAALLTADYVDGRVLAGANLRAGMDAIYQDAKQRQRRVSQLTVLALVLIALIVGIVVLLGRA